ncbi:glucan endo-1,3-beta-glucosidase-like [Impatiens glandulifera]|uniref:glucan endo-1,3-beta-glucosidase-like n=1 Tax=Impatiens glandulifera TaxID=253017 RepID=UPI001FB1874E|nr:glucan endo-1,3-beta-glucosidase-like [Impatiens glandulifera]
MAKSTHLPRFYILLVFCINSDIILNFAMGQAEGQGAWCVAKPSSTGEELGENLSFACRYTDCSIIVDGGSCFFPNTTFNHASVAMNLYYQAHGRHFWNCNFHDSGLITVIDPSYGDCRYAYTHNV